MRCIARIICPAPAAFASPGGWAKAVEGNALEAAMDRLVGDSPWSFIDDYAVEYDRTRDRVLYVYHVPSVLRIKGATT